MLRRAMLPFVTVWLGLLTACAEVPVQVQQPPASVIEAIERPAERALLQGLRLYDDAVYVDAEKQFNRALQLGLLSPKDRAATHKHLAFIYCTSSRNAECETAFRAARLADPGFALSKSEAGHPQWAQVYQRTRL